MGTTTAVVSVCISITPQADAFLLQVDTKYVESTVGRGRMRTDTVRYEHMAHQEMLDVVDAVVSSHLPGEEYRPLGTLGI